jgi:hypothetical protein
MRPSCPATSTPADDEKAKCHPASDVPAAGTTHHHRGRTAPRRRQRPGQLTNRVRLPRADVDRVQAWPARLGGQGNAFASATSVTCEVAALPSVLKDSGVPPRVPAPTGRSTRRRRRGCRAASAGRRRCGSGVTIPRRRSVAPRRRPGAPARPSWRRRCCAGPAVRPLSSASSNRTSWPSRASRSATCAPMSPAPPVISTRTPAG